MPKEQERRRRRKQCYRYSQVLSKRGARVLTPDDLRIAACITRNQAGTTYERFKKINVAVARVLIKGEILGCQLIPKTSDTGIHSEDFIYVEMEKLENEYGKGTVFLEALFSERIPCEEHGCRKKLAQANKTKDFKAYFVVTNRSNKVRTLIEAFAEGDL